MAALTAQRRAELVAYLREDSLAPEDLVLLEQFYQAALAYLETGGVREPTDPGRKAQFDLCVNFLVSDAWDHRALKITEGTRENPAFRQLVNQLKRSEPVPELGTGGEGGGA